MTYKPEFGIRAHDICADTPESLREHVEALQISYVQLALQKSFTKIPWTPHSFSMGLAAEIRKGLGDLRISVLGSYINPLAEGEALEQEMNRYRQNMLFAKFLNAGVVGTETGGSDHSEADYQKVLKVFRRLADDAEKLGVMMGIEGVYLHTINTPRQMRRLLDDIASPNVMTIFDPVNYLSTENYQAQDDVIKEAFELLSDRLVAIHLKDFQVNEGRLERVQTGTGLLNIPLLFDCIRAYKPGVDVLFEESTEALFPAERECVLKKAGY